MDELKISDFKGNYFCKIKILNFGGSKSESIQNPIAILWCAQFYTFRHFLIESYFKTGHSNSIQTFAIFYPKWRSITKRSFSKKWDFSEVLLQMSNWCWGRYWKFRVDICRYFWAIKKNRQGGVPPPQQGTC